MLYATSGAQSCVKLCTEGSPPCYASFSWDRWPGTSWERPNPLAGPRCAQRVHTSLIFLVIGGPVRGQVSVVTPPRTLRSEFTHARWEGKQNKDHSASQCVIYTSANRMWEDGGHPTGGPFFWLFILFFIFFFERERERHSPHRPVLALSTRAENRQLGGPVKVRRSDSYISSPLSRAAELTSALIIAAGLWRRSLRTPGGKPWARMRQWKGASGRASDGPPP